MKTRKLGAFGPTVSAISAGGLGTMSFDGIFGATDDANSLRCLDAMTDCGITFVDTVNIYGIGVSETEIGQWLATRKPNITLATKAPW